MGQRKQGIKTMKDMVDGLMESESMSTLSHRGKG